MLRPEETIERVYLYRKPIDMRKQRTGLAALVQEVMKVDPFCGSLFVFTGRRRDRIKILWWSRNGFILWYKVIEGPERFPWPRLEEDVVSLTPEQLGWLLEGYDVWTQPHRMLKLAHAS